MSKKLNILIVDDHHNIARTLADILKFKGYQAEVAHSGPEALEKVDGGDLDCVLSDIKMPGVNGVQLYRTIKARQPDLPVVLMTAYSADNLVKEGLAAGVVATLTKPLSFDLLFTFFSFLKKKRSIAIVDDNSHFCRTLGDVLQARDFAVVQVTDPQGVIEHVGTERQVVLLDMQLAGQNDLTIFKKIRERHPHLPVILMTGSKEEMALEIETALEMGAYTCLYKPFQIEELFQHLTEIYHRELSRILKRH